MVEKCRPRAKYSPGVSGMRIRVFQRAPVSASRAISVVWLFGLRVLCPHFTAKADLDREIGALQEISQSPHFDGRDAGSNPGHDTNHFVLRFLHSFRSPGNWLRGHATIKRLHCSETSDGRLHKRAAAYTEHASLREKWQGASALPSSSYVNFLRNIQGIVHLNAQIPDGAFNLRMSKEQLNRSKVPGSPIDKGNLGSP